MTNWRRQRLLILCYHGIALEDEHRWCPGLYISPELFRGRMDALERARCSVLPLQHAVKRLSLGELPPRAVTITFDDGFHDFHELAFPVLREHGFPATVYQTTYYTEHRFPVFNLMLDYIFWRADGQVFDGRTVGIAERVPLTSESRGHVVDMVVRHSFRQNYGAAEKNVIAARVAASLGIDYAALVRRRILQLMSAAQLGEISRAGIAVELHTHRHRTPLQESLFHREISDNREAIRRHTGEGPLHFCYPSGVVRDDFLPWLQEQGVQSATTCDPGFATRGTDRLRLPRLLDSTGVSQLEFEGWLSGLSAWLPRPNAHHYEQDPEPFWDIAPERARAASA